MCFGRPGWLSGKKKGSYCDMVLFCERKQESIRNLQNKRPQIKRDGVIIEGSSRWMRFQVRFPGAQIVSPDIYSIQLHIPTPPTSATLHTKLTGICCQSEPFIAPLIGEIKKIYFPCDGFHCVCTSQES
jgi:hypothetical protein